MAKELSASDFCCTGLMTDNKYQMPFVALKLGADDRGDGDQRR